MIHSYLKMAWRNIIRNKISSLINLAGLAIGIACVLLIFLYVQDEWKYDRFLQHADRLYQVNLDAKKSGEEFVTANTPPPVGPALANGIPEIESYTRIFRPGDIVVRNDGVNQTESFTENSVWAVDSNFLQLFTYKLKEGDPATCLEQTHSVVITDRTAKKYFGNTGAIGKILLLDNQQTPYTVTAVLKDLPSQSSFQFEMLIPISSMQAVKRMSWSWVWLQVSTYVKLRDEIPNDAAGIRSIESKFPAIVKQQAASAFSRIEQPFDEFIAKGNRWDFHLQPFTRVHLYSTEIGSRLNTLGNIQYIYIFSIIALFIILLACVNFMNLSTAQASRRAKEVGIRKVLGSVKAQLIKQFITEALLFSLVATLLGMVLVLILLKSFNQVAGKSLDFSLLFSGNVWVVVMLLSLFTGLLAGSYPAFYLTSFKPVAVLKGMKFFKSNPGNLFVRNGLVVFQFTVSTALIVCTIIVMKQLQFTQNANLGLDKENVIVMVNNNRLGNHEESFRQELTKLPGVMRATVSTSIPSKVSFADTYVPEKESEGEKLLKDIQLASFIVDDDFIPTLDIKVLKGRNFAKYFTDSSSVILNETAVKQIGWKDPIGKYLVYPGNSDQRFKVIAVAKDFNIESLRNLVTPFALFHSSSKTYDLGKSYVSVRIKPGNISTYINNFEIKWKSFAPNTPFDYFFLDSEFDALYRSEKRMGAVMSIFTVLSIFIACLGLFGLAAYTAECRTKEIGVRKVLGASVQQIVTLLSKDFVRLVILSVFLAFPIAWWGMNRWLEDFAYRIDIRWPVFAAAGVLAFMIALGTVSFQAIKAAIVNPVKSLRTE